MIENNVKYLLMESIEDCKFKFENFIGYIQTKYEIHGYAIASSLQ